LPGRIGVTPTLRGGHGPKEPHWEDWAQGFRFRRRSQYELARASQTGDPFYYTMVQTGAQTLGLYKLPARWGRLQRRLAEQIPNVVTSCYDGMHNGTSSSRSVRWHVQSSRVSQASVRTTGKPFLPGARPAPTALLRIEHRGRRKPNWDYKLPMLPAVHSTCCRMNRSPPGL